MKVQSLRHWVLAILLKAMVTPIATLSMVRIKLLSSMLIIPRPDIYVSLLSPG